MLKRYSQNILLIFILTVFNDGLSAGAEQTIIIPMYQKTANTFYINANVSGLGESEFMVDTGSGYSTINEQTLNNLKKNSHIIYVKELLGILADGTEKRVSVYRLPMIALTDSCQIRDVEVAVFPGTTRHILGLNTLRKMGSFEFSFFPPQLTVKQCDEV